ncbi:ubiquitin carboxyl-terminal hydrolase 47-like [Lycorma delicatula]|uniref:ubiquitin carboxyl-terminal hydrolase 47-like n=1 Tax=Lycorma delicatula TaxID=130591 RepID=UPI003F51759C
MVCKVVERIFCVVHDCTDISQNKKHFLELPPDTPVRELIQDVANHFNYEPDSFELTLQKPAGIQVVISDKLEGSLEDVGFNLDPGCRNFLVLSPLVLRASPAVEDELSLGASASPTGTCTGIDPDEYPPAPPLPPYMTSSSSTTNVAITEYYTTSALIKHDTGYVGLVNQAMTCYLNSLLQALFMTPEFRNALYKWQFEGGKDEAESIPFELQKLFLNLQTSNRNAVETTELTRSFGWDSSEAWQQHDIQELCRVMFDALEQVLKGTQQADLIDRLYQGKMIDYVRCLECGQEKSREDTFLDIPLPVRPFGSTVAYGSVEEALRAFVQPETLEENNQYHCDQCAKKCDAHKGLKFTKFPYLLTLHLKRFDFDYNTMHRIKLNDKVTFPEILDLNSFIQQEKDEGSEGFPEELAAGKCDDSSTTDSGSALDDESCQGANELSQTDNVQEDDEGIDMSGGSSTGNHHENEKNRQHTMQKGPYVYELFSIMIHSGSASGGHYYAYIKEFSNGEWFCFNDQTVSRITSDDITKTYGGGMIRGYYSGAYSSSTNAYMLMYRQIDKERNCDAMTVDEFPPHIKELHKKLQEREETDRLMKEKESEMCKIKLHCYHPVLAQSNNTYETKLICPNDTTLREATEKAYKILRLEGVVPLEQCRLVSFNKLQDTIEVSFEGRDDEPIVDILSSLRSIHRCDLLMEIIDKDDKFMEYQPGGITLRVYVADLESEEVEGPKVIRGNLSQTVEELLESIGNALNIDPSKMVAVYEKCSSKFSILSNYPRTLKQEGLLSFMKIFVCNGPCDPDPEKKFTSSKLYKLLDRFEHTITFHISLPDTDPETLNSLSIPSLNSPSGTAASLSSSSTSFHTTSSSSNSSKHSEQPVSDRGDRSGAGGTGDTGGGGGSRGALLLPLLLGGGTTTTGAVSTPNVTAAAVTTTVTAATTAVSSTSTMTSAVTYTTTNEVEETGSQGAGGGDQSTSEDSSLTDSDRTLIGDIPEYYPVYNHTDVMRTTNNDEYALSSPAEAEPEFDCAITKFCEAYKSFREGDWCEEEDKYTYFKATPYTNTGSDQKMLKVQVDKRMLLGCLKTALETYVGVPATYFRIYRMYPSQQEHECTILKDSLSVYKDNDQLFIKLGRALRGGEHRVKVYQLLPDSTPPVKFLCDWIIAKGQTVSETKQDLLEDLSRKNVLKIPVERCRLRKKNWKSPARAYLDIEVWGSDIQLESNTEIFLQELPGPEIVKSSSQLLLFVRRWYPSKYQLGSFQEIIMDGRSVSELKTKISEISEIPVEKVEFAKPHVTAFPFDMSVLLIPEMDWNRSVDTIDQWPLQINEDGFVIFYRDNREELKQLTQEERKAINLKDTAKRNGPSSTVSSYSPRKERPLKIYHNSAPRRPRAVVESDVD